MLPLTLHALPVVSCNFEKATCKILLASYMIFQELFFPNSFPSLFGWGWPSQFLIKLKLSHSCLSGSIATLKVGWCYPFSATFHFPVTCIYSSTFYSPFWAAWPPSNIYFISPLFHQTGLSQIHCALLKLIFKFFYEYYIYSSSAI